MENKPTVNTKGRYQLQFRGVECLNCGHPLDLSDKYCPNCSQANSVKKLTLRDFFEEFFSNILSYDSKLFQTLAALFLRPGRITRQYINGKRLSYTNPFRFLLSLAIIYFLLMGFNGEFKSLDRYGNGKSVYTPNITDQISAIEFENEAEKKELISTLDSLQLGSFIKDRVNERDSTILSDPKKHFKTLNDSSFIDRYTSKIQFFQVTLKKDTIYSLEDALRKYKILPNTENKTAFSISRSLVEIENRPGTFVNTFISKLPFATFFFLPFFSVFVWLVYIRKKYTYTDHLIFSFHNQSFFFILLIISFLINAVFKIDSEGWFFLFFAIYLYKAMRNFYKQSRLKTILKYVFLNSIFVILASITAIILIAISAITY